MLQKKPKAFPDLSLFRAFVAGMVCLLAACGPGQMVSAGCSPSVVDLKSGEVQARFRVEVAKTERERARGLMDRERLARSRGMLFVYPAPHRASFWMKNTLIPLDILFLDDTGTVKRIAKETVPYSLEPIPGGPGIQFVLEINGGLSDKLRLSEGTVLRHPEIDQAKAAWKCDETE